MRVQMLISKAVEKERGARRVYEGGRFYILPTKEARALITEGVAVDPDAPAPEPAPEQAPAEAEGGDLAAAKGVDA